jgi:hypothetical protein
VLAKVQTISRELGYVDSVGRERALTSALN